MRFRTWIVAALGLGGLLLLIVVSMLASSRKAQEIILSMHADESYIIRALAAGARAYLLKSATDEDLLPALRAVASGKPFFSPA
jgi:DNA-binding NarL/FixJ family response regulator